MEVGKLEPGILVNARSQRLMFVCLCQAGKRWYSEWVIEIHEKKHLSLLFIPSGAETLVFRGDLP